MKKIFLSSLILLGMAMVFTACEDDRDSNPTLIQPTTFSLNQPVNNYVDLNRSESLHFTWSQPDYGGWPAAVDYQFEVSTTGEWTVSANEAALDDSGELKANYDPVRVVLAGCEGDLNASELAKSIVRIKNWTEDSVIPEEMTIYMRLTATTPGAKTVYSNTVSLTVKPYFIDPTEPVYEVWYLIGDFVGDGSWKNDGMADVGVSILPMYPAYDLDNNNKFLPGAMYIGYIPAGAGFKLIKEPGDGAEQWGMMDGALVKTTSNADNITVDESGIYKIWYNCATFKLTIEKYSKEVKDFFQIGMPGNYQPGDGWDVNGNLMTPFTTANNHDWMAKGMQFDSDSELKFAADGSWDTNWGAAQFPYGLGIGNGENIPVLAGKYDVYFNDILGAFTFIAVEDE